MLFIWNEVSYDVADSFLFKTTSRIYFSYYYKVKLYYCIHDSVYTVCTVDYTRVGHHSAVPFAHERDSCTRGTCSKSAEKNNAIK